MADEYIASSAPAGKGSLSRYIHLPHERRPTRVLAHELLRDGRLVRILDGWGPEGYTI